VRSTKGQFNFVWLFAIVAGAAILVLAIYGVVQGASTAEVYSDTSTAKSVTILTNPLEAGFADASYAKLSFTQETRISITCLEGGLGTLLFETASRKDPKSDWSAGSVQITVANKYIFASLSPVAKEFAVLSMPFEFPYKVADTLTLIDKPHCFVNAPRSVQDTLGTLNIPLVSFDNCSSGAVQVCFQAGSSCDISIACSDASCSTGIVQKSGTELAFIENLLVPAIIADPSNYECNVKRLSTRTSSIAKVLMEKVDLLNARDCSSGMRPELFIWSNLVSNASAQNILTLEATANNLKRANQQARCKAW